MLFTRMSIIRRYVLLMHNSTTVAIALRVVEIGVCRGVEVAIERVEVRGRRGGAAAVQRFVVRLAAHWKYSARFKLLLLLLLL